MENKKLPHDHGTHTLEIFKGTYENRSFEDAADIFSLVSDSTRLKIFCLLCHTEDCVINIAAAVQMSSPAVRIICAYSKTPPYKQQKGRKGSLLYRCRYA